MKLHIMTLSLDSMPFITWHLPTLNRLGLDWTWHIVHGAAMNGGSTKWCQKQQPRLSRDGTTEFFKSISHHPRVKIYENPRWDSKDTMTNIVTENIHDECVLLQMDSDEAWESWQLEKIVRLMMTLPAYNVMQFRCQYFLGQNIIATGESSYGNRIGEWVRAWRFKPGMTFKSHEPPVLNGCTGPTISVNETVAHGLIFQHYAYAFEQQVAFKGMFYGYPNAVAHWRRLQQNTVWPVNRLKDFLPWVDQRASADVLYK